ncbi:MAG: hypothetical protein K2X01_10990 [Cyanobacteria bacterium]|nr:hypothetical protein [Cyanobacteriota bacterium]
MLYEQQQSGFQTFSRVIPKQKQGQNASGFNTGFYSAFKPLRGFAPLQFFRVFGLNQQGQIQ